MPSAFQQFLTGNTFLNPSDEESQAIRREADNAVEGATRRLESRMGLGLPGGRMFRNSLEAAKQELVSQLGWNNPQQAAAAQEAYRVGGYEGLRQLGYELPFTPEEAGDRAAASRHLAPPYAMGPLAELRDIDLLLDVYDDAGEYRDAPALKKALGYYKASYSNPFTHQDYGNPNYRAFAGDSVMDASKAIGHFIQDPQNPVANGLMAMDVVPNSTLAAADNDTDVSLPRMTSGSSPEAQAFERIRPMKFLDPVERRIAALSERLGRGLERTAATHSVRNTGAIKPVPVLELGNDATGAARAERLWGATPNMQANMPVSGQESLHGLGVPGKYNTPAVGMGTEFAASIADPTLFNPVLQAARSGGQAGKSFLMDAATDIGTNAGMTAAVMPSGARSWGQFFTEPYEPESPDEQRAMAAMRTKQAARGLGQPGMREYSREAEQAGLRMSPGMMTPGGMTAPRQASTTEERLRALKEMYDRPYDPR
jgi:hypothetical protein